MLTHHDFLLVCDSVAIYGSQSPVEKQVSGNYSVDSLLAKLACHTSPAFPVLEEQVGNVWILVTPE